MSKIMALDIETGNYSYEIGGWDKTHLFEPTVDMHYAGVLLRKAKENKNTVIDTSWSLRSSAGQAVSLDDVCKHTLGKGKEIMHSEDAPIAWREGKYAEVMKYCLQDCQLNYDLFEHGRKQGVVKARDINSGMVTDYEVLWKLEE